MLKNNGNTLNPPTPKQALQPHPPPSPPAPPNKTINGADFAPWPVEWQTSSHEPWQDKEKSLNILVNGATKKKKQRDPLLSIKYWLAYRDAYVMAYEINPHITG